MKAENIDSYTRFSSKQELIEYWDRYFDEHWMHSIHGIDRDLLHLLRELMNDYKTKHTVVKSHVSDEIKWGRF